MPFSGKGKAGFTVSGVDSIASLREDLHTGTKRAILTDAATFFKNDAVSNAHVITGRTRRSIKVESITDNQATITAGFGMPFEEREKVQSGEAL